MKRRTFLTTSAGFASLAVGAQHSSIPIIDSHVHLYDPTRPQGVPWPSPAQTSIYRRFLPSDYRAIVKRFGVVGMIAMECSPWVEDNYWVLDVAAKDKIVVGAVGSLIPGKPDFGEHLSRLHKNPLFLGIRFGYLWGRNPAAELGKPEFVSDLKTFAGAGLTLDTVGGPQVVTDLVQITDKVPNLRVVLDHFAAQQAPSDARARASWERSLRELKSRPQVYAKVSEVFQRVDGNGRHVRSGGRIPRELSFYRETLDKMWETFGVDRLIFASDWTNSEPMGTFEQTLNLVREYVTGKGQDALEKVLWRNSVPAYRWVKRQPDQPGPANPA